MPLQILYRKFKNKTLQVILFTFPHFHSSSLGLHIFLWILQCLLTLHGLSKRFFDSTDVLYFYQFYDQLIIGLIILFSFVLVEVYTNVPRFWLKMKTSHPMHTVWPVSSIVGSWNYQTKPNNHIQTFKTASSSTPNQTITNQCI